MKDPNLNDEPIRPHEYDGIQEYDNNLPNWWLFTLYAAIAFSIGYWVYYHKSDVGPSQVEEYELALAELEAKIAPPTVLGEDGTVVKAPDLDDSTLWAMSRKSKEVEAGKTVYAQMCAACHGANLEGAIGVNLIDNEWKHGSNPLQIRHTIMEGVIEKGMMPWLPILGEKKIDQVTAYILSHHEEP